MATGVTMWWDNFFWMRNVELTDDDRIFTIAYISTVSETFFHH